MTDQEKLATLWDERNVSKVILTFGRALDTGNWDSYCSCLTDPLNLDFQRLTGHGEVTVTHRLLTRWATAFFEPLRRHHVYSNFAITLDGDCAHALVYMTSRHWKSTDMGAVFNNQYGWYDFDLQRGGETWLINRIKHDFRWVAGNAGLFDLSNPELLDSMQAIFCEANLAS